MTRILSFTTLRRDVHNHPLAFEIRYIVGFAVLGKVGSKACQKQFSLLFEHDRASTEEDVGFHLIAFFEELNSVFEFEVIVMIIGLWTKTNLFDILLLGICFRLFLLFLLRVEEFLVVDDAAHGRCGSWSDLNEIEVLVIGYLHCLLE